MPLTDVRVLDSVTQLPPDADAGVVVAASHGGRYAGHLAARAGVRGVVLNDAGVGKDCAGVGSLPYLDGLGCAAATVSHATARIGDGLDALENGVVSHVNDVAADHGCRVGQDAGDCARRMRTAPRADDPPEYGQSRFELAAAEPAVWGMDSLSLIEPGDDGRVAVTGSHGARLAGEDESYLAADVAAAVFNDAGRPDDAGASRLPVLAERGVPAATVGATTARIGDARSTWADGVVSAVNAPARDLGATVGESCQAFVACVRESRA